MATHKNSFVTIWNKISHVTYKLYFISMLSMKTKYAWILSFVSIDPVVPQCISSSAKETVESGDTARC